MQYLPLAFIVVGSALIIAALMHRASSTRRVVREATSVRPESSAPDWDRAAWLIAGAFTLLGVLQLNTYIERERARDTFDAIMTQTLEAIGKQTTQHDARLQEQVQRDFDVIRRSLVR